MKLKKFWIFWICYYGATVIGAISLIYFFKSSLNITLFSLFPVSYIFVCIGLAWFFPSKFRYNHRSVFLPTRAPLSIGDFYVRGPRIKFKKGEGFSVEETPAYGYNCPEDKFASRVLLLILPLFIPFILFLSTVSKILCGFLLLICPLVTLICSIILQKKETDLHNTKLKQQLKAQQEQEELGKWK